MPQFTRQFTPEALADYNTWKQIHPKTFNRLTALIADIERDPFNGLGKPELLKDNLSGWWSRRITAEHRLVYKIRGTNNPRQLIILSCKGHY